MWDITRGSLRPALREAALHPLLGRVQSPSSSDEAPTVRGLQNECSQLRRSRDLRKCQIFRVDFQVDKLPQIISADVRPARLGWLAGATLRAHFTLVDHRCLLNFRRASAGAKCLAPAELSRLLRRRRVSFIADDRFEFQISRTAWCSGESARAGP